MSEKAKHPYADALMKFQDILGEDERAQRRFQIVFEERGVKFELAREAAHKASVATMAEFNIQLTKVQRLETFLAHLHGVLVTSNPTATVNAKALADEIAAFRKDNP